MSDEYVHKQGLVYKNQFHVIFCPKYRRPVLVDGVDVRLKEILLEKAAELDVKILSIEIMPDHVHLFISFDPRLMLHKIIKILKGSSARILREEFPSLKSRLPSMWTRNYFSCSLGHNGEAAVRRNNQEQKNA